MDSQITHKLIILFDRNQIDISQLDDFARKTFKNEVTTHVGLTGDNNVEITIEGSLEAVDESHNRISKDFIERKHLSSFRLKDTAGDEIRFKAYPILSTIEQELRSFINHCLIDALGFTWWASLGEITLPGVITPLPQRSYHPLEFMSIEQLIDFVTFEKAEWDEESPFLLKDLITVLEKSKSFDNFRIHIQQKVHKISLWQDVFSKYLNVDKDSWQQFRSKDLKFIVDLRNRVMHYRPVHLNELSALEEKQTKIFGLIASARSSLSDEEKNEIARFNKTNS